MKKSFIVLFHIGFWVCYFIMILIILSVYYRSSLYASAPDSRMSIAFKNVLLFAVIPSLITFYSYYFLLFPKYLQRRKIFLSIIMGLLISVVAAVIGYIFHRYLIESGTVIDMDKGGKNHRSTAFIVIFIMTFIGSICGIVALVLKGFITWFNEIKLKESLKEKNFQMEMALIKSQLDPHLLFNTINNIDA